MGFGDKLKGLRDQAQQAVAENKDKIQDAVQTVGEAANTRSHGRYATRIAKIGEKVETSVEKFAQGEPGADTTDASAAPIVNEPVSPVTAAAADEAAGMPTDAPAPSTPPEFE